MMNLLPTITPRAISRFALGQLRKSSSDAFEASLSTAQAQQHEWILNRVRLCSDTGYGKDHGFAEIRAMKDFRRRVPISDYDHFEPYIQAVAGGKSEALIPQSERLIQFTITTGSSGVPKLNPVTDTWLKQYRRAWDVWGMKFFVDHPQHIGSRMLQMSGTWNMGTTPGGYQISMVSALLSRIQNPFLKPYYLIPNIVNEIPDPVVRHYVALRLSIAADVGWILLMNPGTLIRLAEIGDTHADTLLKDLSDGTLSETFEMPAEIRKSLVRHHLRAQPGAARRLAAIANNTGRLLPRDYWKQPAISCWLGGTAGYQSRYLSQYFGESPCRDMGLVSSEGRHTIPLQDSVPWGVPSLGSGFYEFLPVESSAAGGEAVDGRDLEVDGEYRLIMSTAAGYYRFDIGDVVRCRGFAGEAPLIEFVQKNARVGDLEGEKLTEHQVIEGAHRAAAATGVQLSLITAVPRRLANEQPRYDFVVETSDVKDTERGTVFLSTLDAELEKLNFLWKARRREGVLQPPRLHLLCTGEWDRCIQAEVDRRGTGDYQYKHPGLVVNEDWLSQFQIESTIAPG